MVFVILMTKRRGCGLFGGVAQLGERVLCKHEVVGSIPTISTNKRRFKRHWVQYLVLFFSKKFF